MICASPAYLQQHGTPTSLEELVEHDCITFDNPGGRGNWVFDSDVGKQPLSITPRLRVNTVEAALDASVAGLGLARLLSYQVVPALEEGSLVRMLEQYEPDTQPVHLIYAYQGVVPLKLRAFIDFAKERLRGRTYQIK